MYGIYGNIYDQYAPNVSIYTSTMDPMGYETSTCHSQSFPDARKVEGLAKSPLANGLHQDIMSSLQAEENHGGLCWG